MRLGEREVKPGVFETMPLRWAQGQGVAHRGTSWHIVIQDKLVDSYGESNATVQKTGCGRTLVQSDSLAFDDYRVAYLDGTHPAWPVCQVCKEKSK